jgi:3-hydroxy-9,10-secoandrosta-1,3,5(10)-triene-9,17-dione monooxygenase
MVEPTGSQLIERAKQLAPVLAERRQQCAELRRIPDETIADLANGDFFRMYLPTRWGGLACHPADVYEAQLELASGCPSTGWVFGVLAVHTWQLALFHPQAQDEVWQDDTTTLISSSYAPVGKVTVVDGGYRLSGRWSFSSGSDHCKWVFLGAFVPAGEGRPPDMRTFLVPRSDYQVVDTWHVSGLKGTGSNDIVVNDAFVPEHRTHRFNHGFKCNSPGNELNTETLYRMPFGQIHVRSVSTPAVGCLQGALNGYRSVTTKKVATSDGSRVRLDPSSQELAADAHRTLDEVRLVLRRNFTHLMDLAERGEALPLQERVAYRYDSARAVSRCVAAVDGLFTASGGGALFLKHPIQTFFQDVHAIRAHFANNAAKPARNLGGTLLGLDNTDFFV